MRWVLLLAVLSAAGCENHQAAKLPPGAASQYDLDMQYKVLQDQITQYELRLVEMEGRLQVAESQAKFVAALQQQVEAQGKQLDALLAILAKEPGEIEDSESEESDSSPESNPPATLPPGTKA